ncbi:MAG: thioesterase family protein [Pirellulales bacterium]
MLRTHDTPLRVRYDECDPMGFVHHSNYLKYLEIGRTELLRAAGGCYRDMEAAGLLVVVVRIDCRYRKPAKYDDRIVVQTTVAKLTAAKILHEYVIRRVDDAGVSETLLDADVTLAIVDRTGRPQLIPQAIFDVYGIERS